MSDNVIDLGAERDGRRLIVVCSDCNCTTMTLYADGSVACASCELPINVIGGEWRERLPPAPKEAKPVDGFKIIPLRGPKSALERWAASPDVDDIKAMVLIFDDGQVSTSSFGEGFDDEDRRKWLAEQFAKAFDVIIS